MGSIPGQTGYFIPRPIAHCSKKMPHDEKPMTDKCIGCGGTPNFTVQLVLSSRGLSPRRQHASKVIAVCDTCCSPNSPAFVQLKQNLGVLLWMNRNDHRGKLELPEDPEQTRTAPDTKSAAAGDV